MKLQLLSILCDARSIKKKTIQFYDTVHISKDGKHTSIEGLKMKEKIANQENI
jgi:hypothetical protein